MEPVAFAAAGLSKVFNRRTIFADIAFSLSTGDALAVTGRNGSGKSTLVKILARVLAPTRGEVTLSVGGSAVQSADRHLHLGLVSPYLQLYDEFTGWENLDLFRNLRGAASSDEDLLALLGRLGLAGRKDDFVRTYSSGMKQRLKYAFALMHQPAILLLDEPTSNLDSGGIDVVYRIAAEQKERGILIVATNDREDLRLCTKTIDLDRFGSGVGAA